MDNHESLKQKLIDKDTPIPLNKEDFKNVLLELSRQVTKITMDAAWAEFAKELIFIGRTTMLRSAEICETHPTLTAVELAQVLREAANKVFPIEASDEQKP